MFTITKNVWQHDNVYSREAVCTAEDRKLTDGFANGSRLDEIDTGKSYRFDETTKSWLEWSGSGGDTPGGDTPSGDYATDTEVDEALDTIFPN